MESQRSKQVTNTVEANFNDKNNKNINSAPRSSPKKPSLSLPTSPSFSSTQSSSSSSQTSTCLTFRTTLVLIAVVVATLAEIALMACLLIHGQQNVSFLEPNLVGARAKSTAAQVESYFNQTVDVVSDTRYAAVEMGLPFASIDASNGTNNISVQNVVNLISTHSMLIGDEFGRILFCRYYDGSFASSGSSGAATRIQVHRSNATWQIQNADGSAPETPQDTVQVRFNLTSLTALPPAAPIAPTSSTFVNGIFWRTGGLVAAGNQTLLANLPLQLSYSRFYSEGSFVENLFFPIAAAGFSASYSATDTFVNCGAFLQFRLLGGLLRQHLIGGLEGRSFMVGRNNNFVVGNSNGPSFTVTNYSDLGGVWQGCFRGGDLVACFFNVTDHAEYSMLAPALDAMPTKTFFDRHHSAATVSKDDLDQNVHHHSATVMDAVTGIEYLAHGVRLRSADPTFFFVVYYLIPSDYYLRDITSARNVAIGLSIAIFIVGAAGAYFILGLAASAVESLAARMQDPWGFHELKEEKTTFDASQIRSNRRENEKKKKTKNKNKKNRKNGNHSQDDEDDDVENNNNNTNSGEICEVTASNKQAATPVIAAAAAAAASSTSAPQLWKYFKELATIEAQFSIFRMHIENLRGFTRFQLASMNNLDANKNKFESRRRGANSKGNNDTTETTESEFSEMFIEGSSALGSVVGSVSNSSSKNRLGRRQNSENLVINDNDNNNNNASGPTKHSAPLSTDMRAGTPTASPIQLGNDDNNVVDNLRCATPEHGGNDDDDEGEDDARSSSPAAIAREQSGAAVASEPSLLEQLNAHTADRLEKIEENPEKASELIHQAMLQNQLQLQQQQERQQELIEIQQQQQQQQGKEDDVHSKNSRKKKTTETGSNNNNNNNSQQVNIIPLTKVINEGNEEIDLKIVRAERMSSVLRPDSGKNNEGDEHFDAQPMATPTAASNRKKVSFATATAAAEAAETSNSNADAHIDDADYKILQESEEIYRSKKNKQKLTNKNVKLEGRNFDDDTKQPEDDDDDAKNDDKPNHGQILRLVDDDDDGDDLTSTSTGTASNSHGDDDDVVNEENNNTSEHKHDKYKKSGKRMAASSPKQQQSNKITPSSPSHSPSRSQAMKIQNQFYEKFCCVCFHFNFYDLIEFLGNEQSDSFCKSQRRFTNEHNNNNSNTYNSGNIIQIPQSSSSSLPITNNNNNNNISNNKNGVRKNKPDLRKNKMMNDYYKATSFEKQQQQLQEQNGQQQHWTDNAEIRSVVYEKLIEVINAAATLVHDAILTSGATLIEFDGDTILCCIRLRSLYKKSRIFIRLMNQITEIFITAATLSSTESGNNNISDNTNNNLSNNLSKFMVNEGEMVSVSGIAKQYQRQNIDELDRDPINDDDSDHNNNNNNDNNYNNKNKNNNNLDEQSRAKLKLLEAIRRVNVAIGCSVGGLKTIQVDMSSGGNNNATAGSNSSVAGLARPVTFLGPAVGNCCKVATFLVNLHSCKEQAEKAKLYLATKQNLGAGSRRSRMLKGSSIKGGTLSGQRSTGTMNNPTKIAAVVVRDDGNADVVVDSKSRLDAVTLFPHKKEEAKKRVNGNDDDDEDDEPQLSRDESFTNENFLIGISHAMSALFEPDFVTATIIGHVRMTDDLMTLTATDVDGGKQKDMAEIVRIVPLQSGFMYRTNSKNH